MMLLITAFLLLKQLRVKSICGVCFCDYVLQMCPLELQLQDWCSIWSLLTLFLGWWTRPKANIKVCLLVFTLQVIKDCSFRNDSFRSFLLWEASCYRMRTFRKSTEKWGEYCRKEVCGSEPHLPRVRLINDHMSLWKWGLQTQSGLDEAIVAANSSIATSPEHLIQGHPTKLLPTFCPHKWR